MAGHPQARLDDKYRLPLRLASLALGYLAYRMLEPTDLTGGLLVGFGVWLTGVSQVERAMTEPTERLRRIQLIGTVVGLGMIAVGLAFAVL